MKANQSSLAGIIEEIYEKNKTYILRGKNIQQSKAAFSTVSTKTPPNNRDLTGGILKADCLCEGQAVATEGFGDGLLTSIEYR